MYCPNSVNALCVCFHWLQTLSRINVLFSKPLSDLLSNSVQQVCEITLKQVYIYIANHYTPN